VYVFTAYKMWDHLKSTDFSSRVNNRMLIFFALKSKSVIYRKLNSSVSTFAKSKKLHFLL